MNTRELGEILKKRREILKIHQKDLAEISGVALRTIIIVEGGKGNPSFETIEKLTKTLGLEFKIEPKTNG